MSLVDQLREHLKEERDWLAKNFLCRLEFKTPRGGTYGADLISRKLRLMEEGSVIAVKYENGHSFYRHIPPSIRGYYIPTSQRIGEKRWTDETKVKELLQQDASYAAMHTKYQNA